MESFDPRKVHNRRVGQPITIPFPPPQNLGKLGRLGEGQCILGVWLWLRISPAHQPRTNQGPLWALGTSAPSCSSRPSVPSEWWASGDLGDTGSKDRPRDTPKASGALQLV